MSPRRIGRLQVASSTLPVLGLACLLFFATAGASDFSGTAFVREDGSLRVRNQDVTLYGIHIPKTGRRCRGNERPPRCGTRAALALDFRIQGFVHCNRMGRAADGSLVARCWVGASEFDEGQDLSAYLLERGWAVALPDAPIEYQTLERIARKRGLGVWGFDLQVPLR
jgi:endonuclease YncB( thermonuclease family)